MIKDSALNKTIRNKTLLVFNKFADTNLYLSQLSLSVNHIKYADVFQEKFNTAIRAGVNYITTSAHYENGEVEIILGKVIANAIKNNFLKRSDLIIGARGGFYRNAMFSKQQLANFEDVIDLDNNLKYSISPISLEIQLSQSLSRMKLKTIDLYLLQNPECLFRLTKSQNIKYSILKDKIYAQIKRAFQFFEEQVSLGKIKYYGISSSAFSMPESNPESLSLLRCIEIAKSITPNHNFKAISVPLNLLEPDIALAKDLKLNKSILNLAKENNISIISSRPLETVIGGTVIKLIDRDLKHIFKPDIDEMDIKIKNLKTKEKNFLNSLNIELKDKTSIKKIWNFATLIDGFKDKFKGYEHWNNTLKNFILPQIEDSVDLMFSRKFITSKNEASFQEYLKSITDTILIINQHYLFEAAEFADLIKIQIERSDKSWSEAKSLENMSLRACRSTKGISSVLVNINDQLNLEEVLQEFSIPINIEDKASSWKNIKENISQILTN